MKSKMLVSSLLITVMALLLGACTNAPDNFQRIDPKNPPDHKTYGFAQNDINNGVWITCKVTMRTLIDSNPYDEASYLVTFRGPYDWNLMWEAAQMDYSETVLNPADAKLQKGLGISSTLWQAGSDGANMFKLNPVSGIIDNPVDDVSLPLKCPGDWTVTYNLALADHQATSTNDTAIWNVSISLPNDGPNAYFKIESTAGSVEFPLRPNELDAIMGGKYDPATAMKDVQFSDATSTYGAVGYATQVWSTATAVQSIGEIVCRYSWTSIESQELVLNFCARQLLLKAWISGKLIHQPAFFGYMRDRNLAVTDVKVRTDPISGVFALGFGSVGGGDSTIDYSQSITSEPSISGDLYLLNDINK